MGVAEFNGLPAEAAEAGLRACNAAPRFVAEVAAGRPYPTAEALVERAQAVAEALEWAEVEQALEAHPRIGEQGTGDSRREQAAVATAQENVKAAIAEGNRLYEERFGHVFLIRAAGRSPEEILAELTRRLAREPEEERAEATAQLAQITRLRVERLVAG